MENLDLQEIRKKLDGIDNQCLKKEWRSVPM